MLNRSCAVCLVLWLSFGACQGGEKELAAAKLIYAHSTDAARALLVKTLDSEIERYAQLGDASGALALKKYRGELLIGLITAEEFRERGAQQIQSALHDALNEYITVLDTGRQSVEKEYAAATQAALASNDLDRAARLREELQLFQSGEYAPSSMEVDRQKPYIVRRVLVEPMLALPLSDGRIPDELAAGFQAQRFRISGTKRNDLIHIDGKPMGHFGKAVLFEPPRARTVQRHGYLWLGVRSQEARYAMVVAAGNNFDYVIRFEELDLETIYEWSVRSDRRELVFEIQRDGTVVKSARIPGEAKSIFGFSATVRFVGGGSNLVVALD
jgi:hypothetical protein